MKILKIADNNNEFKKILCENENLKKEINDLKKENLKLIKTLQEDW